MWNSLGWHDATISENLFISANHLAGKIFAHGFNDTIDNGNV